MMYWHIATNILTDNLTNLLLVYQVVHHPDTIGIPYTYPMYTLLSRDEAGKKGFYAGKKIIKFWNRYIGSLIVRVPLPVLGGGGGRGVLAPVYSSKKNMLRSPYDMGRKDKEKR